MSSFLVANSNESDEIELELYPTDEELINDSPCDDLREARLLEDQARIGTEPKQLRTKAQRNYWLKMATPDLPNINQILDELDALEGKSDVLHQKRTNSKFPYNHSSLSQPVVGCGSSANPPPRLKSSGTTCRHVSVEAMAMKRILNHISEADIQMFKATQAVYHLDGTVFPKFSAQKMVNAIRNDHMSSERAANKLGFLKHPDLHTMPNEPFSFIDNEGVLVLYSMPGYFTKKQTLQFTDQLVKLADAVKLGQNLADRHRRGSHYHYQKGRPTGVIHCAITWTGIGAKKAGPSSNYVNGGHTSSVTKGTLAFQAIQEYLNRARELSTLVNYALFRLDPGSYRAHVVMNAVLRRKLACARALATNNPVQLTGCAYIYSRSTPLHFDEKESPEGWAILVVMGDCETGMLSIPRLKIKIRYLPGHLVLLRGRLLDHEVIDWDGKGLRSPSTHGGRHALSPSQRSPSERMLWLPLLTAQKLLTIPTPGSFVTHAVQAICPRLKLARLAAFMTCFCPVTLGRSPGQHPSDMDASSTHDFSTPDFASFLPPADPEQLQFPRTRPSRTCSRLAIRRCRPTPPPPVWLQHVRACSPDLAPRDGHLRQHALPARSVCARVADDAAAPLALWLGNL
ncbi:hypothetical protein FRC07_010148 [Ceratobasidium sp. 392]|nr:hypothetical protein FRC07_010148 [Ceratobasidium sp. 392]